MPFFEPLIRCFLLGVASGGLLEAFNAMSELAQNAAGTSNVWLRMAAYPPHFVQDHVLAIILWVALYAAESAGVRQSLRKDGTSLGGVLAGLAKFPKTLLPLRMTLFKHLWLNSPYFKSIGGNRAQLQAQPAGFVGVATFERPPPRSTLAPPTSTTAPPAAGPPSARHAPNTKGATTTTGTQSKSARQREAAPTNAFVEDRPAREGLKPGQWDPELGRVARRNIARQSYLQDMYYCLATLPEGGLKEGQLYEARIMGKSITYWQDKTGKINAISNICTHRGAQLSKGWLDEVDGTSCVRCPYHAWAFAGDGTVRHIPVQTDGKYPKRPLQEVFDCRVADSKLWLYWGNARVPSDERAPVPGTGLSKDVAPATVHVSKTYEVPHHLAYELLASDTTLRDAAAAFLGALDPFMAALGPAMRVDKGFAIAQEYSLHAGSTRRTALVPGANLPPAIPVRVTAELPSSVQTTFRLDGGRVLTLQAHVQPVTYDTCSVHLTMHRNFVTWPGSNLVVRDALDNFAERLRAHAEGKPFRHEIAPLTRQKLDGPVLDAFYALRDEFVSLGFGVPPEVAMQPHRSDM